MSITIKHTKGGTTIRATGTDDCRGVMEAMGMRIGNVDALVHAPVGQDATAPARMFAIDDPQLLQARATVIELQKASVSLVQRYQRIGYNMAARLLDQLESDGVIGPYQDGRRAVLVRSVAARMESLRKVLKSAGPKTTPQTIVDAWNSALEVGQAVDYREVYDSIPQRLKTRSHAEVLSGHTAVVWLEGKSGCVCCDHCTPVTEGGAS